MLFGSPLRDAISLRGSASPEAWKAVSTRDECTTDLTRYGSRGVGFGVIRRARNGLQEFRNSNVRQHAGDETRGALSDVEGQQVHCVFHRRSRRGPEAVYPSCRSRNVRPARGRAARTNSLDDFRSLLAADVGFMRSIALDELFRNAKYS